MHRKKILLTHFSRAFSCKTNSIRPNTEQELIHFMLHNKSELLCARGAGLSYNDSCFSPNLVLDLQRFNHLLSFESSTGIAVCQGATPLKDLFLLDAQWMPAVIPGTIHATVAGCVAHDVHGKNNPQEGSFGHHICWLDLLIQGEKVHCSPEQNSNLFYATIGGLGLTGVILQLAIRMKKSLAGVLVKHALFDELPPLLTQMLDNCEQNQYQVAWLDLLNPRFKAILSIANPAPVLSNDLKKIWSIPPLPFSLIRPWNMKLFNSLYIKHKKLKEQLSFQQFNNPLDSLAHWNRLYGPQGFMQFQAVFPQEQAVSIMEQLIDIINFHKAKPILSVLKLFTKPGKGLLSFCKPGFTLAIDFMNNESAKKTVFAMNQLTNETTGRVYLAKDFLLTPEQYQNMYPQHEQFFQVLTQYPSSMHSSLAKRLGIK